MLDPNRYELNAATVGFRKRMRQEVSMEAFEMALQQQTDTIKVRREEKETPISEIHVMGAQRFGLGGNEKTKTAERQWRQIHGYPLRSFKADGGPIVLPVKRVESALATPMNVGLTQYLKYNATVGEYVSRITEPVLDHITSENPMIKQARVTGMEQTYAETMDNLRQWNEKRSNQYQNAMARAMAAKNERVISAGKVREKKATGDMSTSPMGGGSSSKKVRRALELERGREPRTVPDPPLAQPYGDINISPDATQAQIGGAYASRSADRSYDYNDLMDSVMETWAASEAYDSRNQPAAELNEDELLDFQMTRSSTPARDRRNRTPNPRSGSSSGGSNSAFDQMMNSAFTPAMRVSERLAVSANLSGSSVREGMPGPPVSLVEPAVLGAVATGSNGGSLSVTDQLRQNQLPMSGSLEPLRRSQASFEEQLQQAGNVPTSNLVPITPERARDSSTSYSRLAQRALGVLGFSAAAPVEPVQTPLAGNATRSFNSAEGNTDLASPASASSLLQASQGFRSRSASSSRPQGRQNRVAIEGSGMGEEIDFRSPMRQRPSPANIISPRGNRIANQAQIN